MKRNTDKCHLIISSNDSSEMKIRNSLMQSSNCEKLVSVKIATKLTFDDHIKYLCRKANSKLCAPNLVLNLIENVKPGFLLSLICMFLKSDGINF